MSSLWMEGYWGQDMCQNMLQSYLLSGGEETSQWKELMVTTLFFVIRGDRALIAKQPPNGMNHELHNITGI